jgi:hypothetical protein
VAIAAEDKPFGGNILGKVNNASIVTERSAYAKCYGTDTAGTTAF